MVGVSIFGDNDSLAWSFARQGVSAARMLGWWRDGGDVPAEAFANAERED
jgi:hypothetical protein